MKVSLNHLGIGLIAILAFSGCVNLKHVNQFSLTSLESIKSFEDLNYSFEQSCKDKCIDEHIYNLELKAQACNCQLDKVADSITLKIYNTIYGYFDGLSKLSNNDLTAYKTEDLETALIEGDFGSITIEEKHVTSYSKMSRILIRAFTDTYRKKKIKDYVKAANKPIKELIVFLDLNIAANLNGKLNTRQERLEGDYLDIIKDASLSAFEKRNALKEFYAIQETIQLQKNKNLAFSKALLKVSEGHQNLYDNIDKLSLKTVQESLFQYASEIRELVVEFKKLKA